MEHPSPTVDAESLQGSGRRRRCCLDACLLVSVLCLLVAVGGLMVVGFYQMENYAYLRASAVDLEDNSTMHLESLSSSSSSRTSVGKNFIFDPENFTVVPKQSGIFFMFLNLHLKCTYPLKAGQLRVTVGDKLTCEVELMSSASVIRNCWTMTQIANQKLIVQVTVPDGGLSNCELVPEDTGLGIFHLSF